ncbi:hypothetical protein MAR_027261 [Mya arenaria]|uniref:Uncharacterized protein n=1 Tax=Mya arenaria TaxID=6604 RepID=A0ABY7EW79_MYAAR|nr:hypothetical protein MAR_027261 [Mya arenaria]
MQMEAVTAQRWKEYARANTSLEGLSNNFTAYTITLMAIITPSPTLNLCSPITAVTQFAVENPTRNITVVTIREPVATTVITLAERKFVSIPIVVRSWAYGVLVSSEVSVEVNLGLWTVCGCEVRTDGLNICTMAQCGADFRCCVPESFGVRDGDNFHLHMLETTAKDESDDHCASDRCRKPLTCKYHRVSSKTARGQVPNKLDTGVFLRPGRLCHGRVFADVGALVDEEDESSREKICVEPGFIQESPFFLWGSVSSLIWPSPLPPAMIFVLTLADISASVSASGIAGRSFLPSRLALPAAGTEPAMRRVITLSDIDDHVLPVLNSPAFDEFYFSFYTGTDDSHIDNISFDVIGRNLTEVVPVVEQSHYGALTETILEDRGITWTVIDGGSQRGSNVLISSLGYAYGVKRENKASTIWRCISRIGRG